MAWVVLRSGLCNAVFSRTKKPGLDQVQPGGVGGSPYEFHVVGHGTPQVQGSAMCAEVVPNQIDLAVRAIARKQRVLEKA